MSKNSVTYFVFSTKSLSVTAGGQWNEEEKTCLKEGKCPENFQTRKENELKKVRQITQQEDVGK